MNMPERALIGGIRATAAAGLRGSGVRVGIGDDCAVLRLSAGEELLVTTDLFIEDVHFRRAWYSARQAGERCLVRGLSDVAAMAGRPLAAFLSLGLPAGLPSRWGLQFSEGVVRLAEGFGIPLAGGDTAQHPDRVIADIVVLGAAPKGRSVLRSGAEAGDGIYVTGRLGAANRNLRMARARANSRRSYSGDGPRPLIEVGLKLRGIAKAMIDTSDGLSIDLSHVADESGVSAVIDAALLPIAAGADLSDALHGGEDYQLLFTASPRTRVAGTIAGVKVTRIGEVVKRRRSPVSLRDREGRIRPLPARGWQHFVEAI